MAALEDNCKLLASLLDDCLKVEIGDEQFHSVQTCTDLKFITRRLWVG